MPGLETRESGHFRGEMTMTQIHGKAGKMCSVYGYFNCLSFRRQPAELLVRLLIYNPKIYGLRYIFGFHAIETVNRLSI